MIVAVMSMGLVFCNAGADEDTSEERNLQTTDTGRDSLDTSMDASNKTEEFSKFEDFDAGDISGDFDRERYKIGVCVFDLNNDFFNNSLEGVKSRCEERNCDVLIESANNNASEEIRILENLQTMNVDAVIQVPLNNVSSDDYQKELLEAGIPVINYCFQTDHHTSEISCDNYHDGELYAEMAAKWVKARPELMEREEIKCYVYDVLTLDSMHARCVGIRDRIQELLPNVKVLEVQEVFTSLESVTRIAENVLLTDPDTYLWLPWCDVVALACIEGLENAGMTGDDCACFGDDGTLPALQKIAKENSIFKETMYYDTFKMGEQLVDLAIAAIEGEELSHRYYYIDPEYVNQDNVQEYIARYEDAA